MNATSINLLLADDDWDDCMFFREAVKELPYTSSVTTVNDGEELMNWLTMHSTALPDVLFLDLNMPRKTGYECLGEIMQNERLSALPVVVYSTSLNQEMVNSLYDEGARYYIRKPGDFMVLKKVIGKALDFTIESRTGKTARENFVIQA